MEISAQANLLFNKYDLLNGQAVRSRRHIVTPPSF